MKMFTIIRRDYLTVVVVIVAIFLISNSPVTATSPITQELHDLKIEGHFFTTAISSENRTIYTKDPAQGRYLVLVLSATLPEGSGKIFATDVTLLYANDDDKESRSRCGALTLAKSTEPEQLFNLQEFAIGNFSWLKVKSGQSRFALAFYIEPDVEVVDLYRLGVAEPLTYRIGTDRLDSVYITTNIDAQTLLQAREVIEKGGYNVVNTSELLSEEEKGITIHYREQAESQAREISQRLMIEFGQTPTLQKMSLITDVDIVIWLGE